MLRCAFTIASDTRYLAPLRQWIAAMGTLAGRRMIPRRTLLACTLVLIEAVDNAIFHAHRGRRSLPIRVAMSVQDDAVVLEVVDQGRGVGRHRLARPEALVAHGRGLYLIHRLMTRVESRMQRGQHVLRMTCTL